MKRNFFKRLRNFFRAKEGFYFEPMRTIYHRKNNGCIIFVHLLDGKYYSFVIDKKDNILYNSIQRHNSYSEMISEAKKYSRYEYPYER